MVAVFVKICGVTRVDQAQALAQLDIQAVGLIGVPGTPRYINPEHMQTLVTALPPSLETVGVFRNRPVSEVIDIAHQVGLTTLQLHGDETPADCERLAQECPAIGRIKAFRIKDPRDLEVIQDYQTVVDRVLVDTYHPHQWGGTGIPLDWSLLRSFQFPRPWILAGGLNPENIQTALTLVHPFGIDVSSGVENAPGDKDLEKVKRLLEQIRPLEQPSGVNS